MKKLTAALFAKGPKLRSETIKVPEWGGVSITLTEMDGLARAEYEEAISNEMFYADDGKSLKRAAWRRYFKPLVIAAAMPVEDRLDVDLLDLAKQIARWKGAGIERVFAVADRLNIISDQALEEVEKNSESDPSNDSSGESR